MTEKTRDAYLRRTYNITLEQYNAVLERQGGVCAICKRPSDKNLHVDHDHKTGYVRGLLCYHCNHRILGNVTEPWILESAAKYLRNPPFSRLFGLIIAPKRKRRRKKK